MNLQQLNKPLSLSFKNFAKKPDDKGQGGKLKIALSLDIGSYNTKMLLGRQKADSLFVEQAVITRTPEKAYADGEITDGTSLGETLKHLITQANTSVRDLVFSIDSTKILKREFIIPQIPDEDILGLVTYEMGQYLPIDISGYSIQPKVIGAVMEGDEEKIRVAVNAVPRNMIQAYQKLFTDVGLKPVSMDINPNSVEKLLLFDIRRRPSGEYADKNVVFIDMGHSFFNVSVYENGNYQFSQDIEIGGRMIDAMMGDLLRIDAEKARKVKKEICGQLNAVELDKKYGRAPSGYQPRSVNEEALIGLLSILNNWAGQVDNVLQYMSHSRVRNIDKIYLYGGSSFINGIDAFFESKLAIKTAIANAFGCCEYKQGINPQGVAATHTNALGAILRL